MKHLSSLLLVLAALASTHCDRGSSSSSGGTGGGPAPVKTAMDACRRFVGAGAAKDCHEEAVEPALTPGARQRVVFLLPSGKQGQVFSFDDKDSYDKSAKSIEDLSSAGRHHWGNQKARIYVQLNKSADDAEAQRVRDTLDGF